MQLTSLVCFARVALTDHEYRSCIANAAQECSAKLPAARSASKSTSLLKTIWAAHHRPWVTRLQIDLAARFNRDAVVRVELDPGIHPLAIPGPVAGSIYRRLVLAAVS